MAETRKKTEDIAFSIIYDDDEESTPEDEMIKSIKDLESRLEKFRANMLLNPSLSKELAHRLAALPEFSLEWEDTGTPPESRNEAPEFPRSESYPDDQITRKIRKTTPKL